MSRWFRMHDEILDDPKVQRLPANDFKGWVNLLCLASKNNGKLPAIQDIAFALRETEDAVSTLLERLLNGGLIERKSGGADGMHYAPYKWAERQYKSDTSTGRVKRFRERSKPVTETAPDTETEADSSVGKPTGVPPADPLKELFDVGVAVLTASGLTEQKARSLIGKHRKAVNDDGKVLAGLLECRTKAIANPVEWLEKRLKSAKWVSATGYEYRGSDEQVMREAERRNDMTTYWAIKAAMKAAA